MPLQKTDIRNLIHDIKKSQRIILTTHKSCDSDGLGSILALHDSLQSIGKKVQSLSIGEVPKRYNFMKHHGRVETYPKQALQEADLALIFDTNDPLYVEPLYSDLLKKTKKQVFIDHHCPVQNSSKLNLLIDENAASTGELCHILLEEMKIPITKEVARSLYISIMFDTHMFRSSKNLSQAFYTCSKLCHHVDANEIYNELFCQYDHKNWQDIIKLLNQVQYNKDHSVAFIECSYEQFQKNSLSIFHILDILDWVMKVQSVLVGFISIEKKTQLYKLSFRSKKGVNVASLAESLGGGGHIRSAGATLSDYSRDKIIKLAEKAISS